MECGTESPMERRVCGTGGSVVRYFTFNLGVSNWGYLFKWTVVSLEVEQVALRAEI